LLENLVKFDRVVSEKILTPVLENICKLTRLHVKSDFERALKQFDAEGAPEFQWYHKLEKSLAIVASSKI